MRHLSYEAITSLFALTPEGLADVFREEFDEISVNALLRMLNALDQNASIVITPKHIDDTQAHTAIV